MSEEIGKRFIDLKRVFMEKNPALARRMPRFLFRWVELLVKVDEINQMVYKLRAYAGLDWVWQLVKDFNLQIEVIGLEKLPPTGNQMVVSNHPLGGLDGMALLSEIGRKRSDVKFPVNDILLKLPGVNQLFVPINKHGRNHETLELLESAFKSESLLLFFPAGLVSRKQAEGIRDLEWKQTFITKSIEYQRDVIPVFIEAYNSNFFYRLALWRKKLGIKANLEMLFLPSEAFKQRNTKIKLVIGDRIPYQHFDKSKSKKQWAEEVKNQVYQLAKDHSIKLR